MKVIKNNLYKMEFVSHCKFCKSILLVNYVSDVFITIRKYDTSAQKYFYECPICNRKNQIDSDEIPQTVKEIVKQRLC